MEREQSDEENVAGGQQRGQRKVVGRLLEGQIRLTRDGDAGPARFFFVCLSLRLSFCSSQPHCTHLHPPPPHPALVFHRLSWSSAEKVLAGRFSLCEP